MEMCKPPLSLRLSEHYTVSGTVGTQMHMPFSLLWDPLPTPPPSMRHIMLT